MAFNYQSVPILLLILNYDSCHLLRISVPNSSEIIMIFVKLHCLICMYQ